MKIKSCTEDAYFVASNSGRGFYSYYAQCFGDPRIRRVYAVKGGPGTGKSRFLREIAAYAIARGWACETVYCSSDPDSTDGVILTRGSDCMAFLDATSPHTYELERPGVRDELIDLGAFWDPAVLAMHRDEIESLNTRKNEAYRCAYRYLAAAEQMQAVRDSLVAPYIAHAALARYAKRLMQGVAHESEHRVHHALVTSVGMQGEVMLDSFFVNASRIVLLQDCYGVAYALLRELLEICRERGLAIRLSHDPVTPELPNAILLRSSGICFAALPASLCRYPCRVLSLRRFVDTEGLKGVRREVRLAARIQREMLAGAVASLHHVGQLHFGIEALYGEAMDFAAKEDFTKKLCKKLFDLQIDPFCDTI